MEQMAAVGGIILVVFAVMLVVGLLVGGLVLKFSVKLIEKFSPGYGKSVLVVLVSGIVGFVVNVIASMALGAGASAAAAQGSEAAMAGAVAASLAASGISLVAYLFILAFFINLMIKRPDGNAIGYGRACLSSLLYLVIMVVLGIIVSLGLGVLMAVLGVGAASMMG